LDLDGILVSQKQVWIRSARYYSSPKALKSEIPRIEDGGNGGAWLKNCSGCSVIEYHRLSANAEMVQYRADLSHMC
jgi:hypothetical protein